MRRDPKEYGGATLTYRLGKHDQGEVTRKQRYAGKDFRPKPERVKDGRDVIKRFSKT